MVKSKLVKIHDEGTEFVICVTKFEESDRELVRRSGWEVKDTLTLITELGNEARSVMSNFHYPEYDIPERTGKMGVNGTTLKMTEQLSIIPFDDIPHDWDVRNGGTDNHIKNSGSTIAGENIRCSICRNFVPFIKISKAIVDCGEKLYICEDCNTK